MPACDGKDLVADYFTAYSGAQSVGGSFTPVGVAEVGCSS